MRYAAALLLTLTLLWGCAATPAAGIASVRCFDFNEDTFAYPNELLWEYSYDANGKWTTHKRDSKPVYAQHCFVVARSVRQFFDNARFDPRQPVADDETYNKLVRRVVSSDPRHALLESKRIVIPGYSNLREFSQGHESLLKAECGGAWQSYFQRGHWRMIFPFSRHQQQRVAEQLVSHLERRRPVVVHVVRFPQLSINHAVVIYDAKRTQEGIDFITYDPNQPAQPITLKFESATRTFLMAANNYYRGGRVDLYEIFYKWNY